MESRLVLYAQIFTIAGLNVQFKWTSRFEVKLIQPASVLIRNISLGFKYKFLILEMLMNLNFAINFCHIAIL